MTMSKSVTIAFLLCECGAEVAVRSDENEVLSCVYDNDNLEHDCPCISVNDFADFFARTTGEEVERIVCV